MYDANIKQESNPDKQNKLRPPVKPIEIFDCILNTKAYYQPSPPPEFEGISKTRENYLRMYLTQKKCFNKKLGLFTDFVNSTKVA